MGWGWGWRRRGSSSGGKNEELGCGDDVGTYRVCCESEWLPHRACLFARLVTVAACGVVG